MGSVVSVPPLFPQRGDEEGVRLLWVRPLWGTWPVYFFLYWGWYGERAQSETWKQKGRTRGLISRSERLFACEFVQLVFLYVWVRIVLYFNVYVCLCVWLFCIDLCFHFVLLPYLGFVCFVFCYFFNGDISL